MIKAPKIIDSKETPTMFRFVSAYRKPPVSLRSLAMRIGAADKSSREVDDDDDDGDAEDIVKIGTVQRRLA